MDDGLTQRDGGAVAAVASHVAAGIVEKWWRQHMSDFDGGATRAPGLELQGKILGQTRVVIPSNGNVFYAITLLKALLGYTRTDSLR